MLDIGPEAPAGPVRPYVFAGLGRTDLIRAGIDRRVRRLRERRGVPMHARPPFPSRTGMH